MDFNSGTSSPWAVNSLYDYLYFCCPECESKTPIKQDFVRHAVLEHPSCLQFFKEIQDGSIEDISLSSDALEDIDIDVKDELIEVKEESFEEPEKVRIVPTTVLNSKQEYSVDDGVECPNCDFKTISQNNMKLHLERFCIRKKCPYPNCSELYHHKEKLDAHIKSVHTISKRHNSHDCPECDEIFKNRKHLISHLRKVHKRKISTEQARGGDLGSSIKVSRKTREKKKVVEKQKDPSPKQQLEDLMKKYGSVSKDGKVTITTNKEGYQKLQEELKTIRELIDKQKQEEEESKNLLVEEEDAEPEVKIETDDKLNDESEHENHEDVQEESGENQKNQNKNAPEEPKSCSVCGETFMKAHLLRRHQKFKHHINADLCTLCGQTFELKSKLRLHEFQKHGIADEATEKVLENVKIRCDICQADFETTNKLNDHALECNKSGKRYACPHCNKYWISGNPFLVHMKLDHGFKDAMSCNICGKSMATVASFENHTKYVHGTSRNCICDLCGYAFVDEKKLKAHITHKHERKQKVFTCEYCGLELNGKEKYNVHVNSKHTKAKTFPCDKCDFVAYKRFKLKLHIQQTHEGDKYRTSCCPYCDFKTFDNYKLKRHVNAKHTKEIEYKCDICTTFVSYHRSSLMEHRTKVHKHQGPYTAPS